MTLEPGQMLLHYQMVEKIGQGGMGVVWKAVDTTLDREVAIKILPEDLASDATRLARFEREAKILASLNHPGIASIFSVHESDGVRFLAMELVAGEVLTRRIPRDGLPLDELLSIALPLTDGVALAHRQGIAHRDLKPDNVMITADGKVKVLDFGLAKSVVRPGLDDGTQAATASVVTAEGRIFGSTPYMSPEQVEGKALDPRSDVFSLGILLHEMATGERPFAGDTPISTLSAILRETPPPVSSIRRALPHDLDAVVTRCLEKDPARRFRNAAELRDALQKLQAQAAGAGSRRRPLWLVAAGVALAAAVAAGAFLWPSGSPSEAEAPAAVAQAEEPGGLTIAVLPFANASGDPEQDYFSDGLTEDIITELSRYRELSVFARSSTARYRESDADVKEIGADLGARYVLQGSVRKAGKRIRLSVQLSNAAEARSVWGESYERDLTARDLFALQDELTLEVVNAIASTYGALTQVGLAESRRKHPASLDAYDCVLRTYEYLQVHTPENHFEARKCLEGVLADNDDFAEGKAWLAYLYGEEYHHRINERTEEYDALDRALALAEEAVRLDPANHVTRGNLAHVLFFRGEYERGRIEAERTVELGPNSAWWLYATGGLLVTALEDFERGLALVRRGLSLTPHHPPYSRGPFFHVHYRQGRYEEALVEARNNEAGDFRDSLFLAATYGQLDRPDDARQAMADLRATWPGPFEEIRTELTERNFYSPGIADHLMEGLRKTGLVEEFWPARDAHEKVGPSIAVLPFANTSGDPEQDYFSAGLTEDIIRELSRYRELSVFAHSSTARYGKSDADVKEIGAALGARYILRGSVRKAGKRIRLSVQLSSVADGRSLWGESYDRDLTTKDIFALQDEMTERVVNAIAGSYGALTRAELPGARRKPPGSLDSYDCVLRAYEYLHVHTEENHLSARSCLEEVVTADPSYAESRAWLAYLYAEEFHHRRNERPGAYDPLDRALELAEESVRLESASQVTHGVLALVLFFRGDYERARIEAYRTIDLSPKNALWLALIGTYLAQQEDFEHGLPMVQEAMALMPHPPAWIKMAAFFDNYHRSRYEEALADALGLDLENDFRGPLFAAAAYGQLGRGDQARSAVAEMKSHWSRPLSDLRPELIERHALAPGLTDHLLEGIARTGLVDRADLMPAARSD